MTSVKYDFIASTYPLIASFNESITEREYASFLLKAESVIGPSANDEFFIVLDSCPRNQGAIRALHERVTTRLDVCSNPYRFWCDKICRGSRSMIEPNVIVGPFKGGKQRAKRREMLAKTKSVIIDARGIPQRLACLMEFARQHGVWLLTVIPPVLPSSQLSHFYNMLEEHSTEGIFAKTDADA